MGAIMTAKIKSALSGFSGLSLDEKLIIAATASLILPDVATAALLLVLLCFVMLSRKRREKMLAVPGHAAVITLLFVFMLPVVLEPSYVTLVLGLGVWGILMLMLYIYSVMTTRLAALLMDTLLALGVIASVYGLFDHFFIRSMVAGELRTASIFENANHYGYAIEIFVFICICRFYRTKKPVYLVLMAVNIASIMLCDCRAAWIAIAVGVIAMIPFAVKNKRRLALVFLCGFAACAALLLLLPLISERFSLDAITVSLTRRVRMWDNAITWIKQSPIIGHGVGSYIPLSKQGNVRELMHAHNMILGILLDTGVIGLGVLGWMGVRICTRPLSRRFVSRSREISALIVATLAATLAHGMIDYPIFAIGTGYLIALVAAMGGASDDDDAVVRV